MSSNKTLDEVFNEARVVNTDESTMMEEQLAAVIAAVDGMKTQMAELQQHYANAPQVLPQQPNVVVMPQEKVKDFDGSNKKIKFTSWVDDLIDLAQEFGWTALSAHRRGCRAIEGPLKERLKKLQVTDETTLDQLRAKYLSLYVGDKNDFKPFQKAFFEYKQEEGESLDAYRQRIERVYQAILADYKTNPITAFFVMRAFCIGLRDRALFATAVPEELKTIDDAYNFCKTRVKVGDAVRSNYKDADPAPRAEVASDEPVPMEIDALKDVRCFNCGRPGHLRRNCRAPKKAGDKGKSWTGKGPKDKPGKSREKKKFYKKKIQELQQEIDKYRKHANADGNSSSDSSDSSEDEPEQKPQKDFH